MIPAEPTLRKVYLLLHEIEPLRQGAEREVVTRALEGLALPAFNHSTFRAGESGAAAVSTARTLPMMDAHRLVVLRDLQDGPDAFFEALAAYLAAPSDSTVLVLSGTGFPKVEKGGRRWSAVIPKAVQAAGGFELDRKANLDPVRFSVDAASRLGKRMDTATARVLVGVVGPRPGLLEREIEKLALYAGDAPAITAGDVEAVCALVAEAAIWDLTTALAVGDRPATLEALERLLGDGLDPRYLLNMITWKLRSLLVGAEVVRAGATDGEVAKAAGLRFDDVRAVRRAVEAGLEGAHQVLGRLAKANQDMNSHRAGDRRVLERLVLHTVAPAR